MKAHRSASCSLRMPADETSRAPPWTGRHICRERTEPLPSFQIDMLTCIPVPLSPAMGLGI